MAVHAQRVPIGEGTVIEVQSPTRPHAVVFEDDGDTGYLYALDPARGDDPIIDALHVYSIPPGTPTPTVEIAITWSADGSKALLLVEGQPQVVYDFGAGRAYARAGLPNEGHDWDDAALDGFDT